MFFPLSLLAGLAVYLVWWPLCMWSVNVNAKLFRVKEFPPLPDLGHAILPQISPRYTCISNALSYTSSWSILLYSLFFNPQWRDNYIWYMASLQALRCVCFMVTILPESYLKSSERPLGQKILFGANHDLLFSGHIMHFYAPMLFLHSQGIVWGGWWFMAKMMTAMIGMLIVATRSHYTIDVLMAAACSHWLL